MKHFQNEKAISEYIVKQGGWSKSQNFGCFFIWFTEFEEKTDFEQLIISLSNETENPV